MNKVLSLLILAARLVAARLANDWDKPCFHGECAYDLPASSEFKPGILKIYGSPGTITDITPASGWVILDCDPNALVQDIRLVCRSEDLEGAGCSHLFDYAGPVNKLARLPEGCGRGPFVRISNVRVAEDQSIPSHADGTVLRRAGVSPTVHIVSVDTNFAAADLSQMGSVQFSIVGGNLPGLEDDFQNHNGSVDTYKIPDHLRANHGGIAPEVTINKSMKLIDVEKTCLHTKAASRVTVDGKAHMTIVLGIYASGTIYPPFIKSFSSRVDFASDLDGRVLVSSSLNGYMDSGEKSLLWQGIPGMKIPGIITISPSFELRGRARAEFSLGMELDIGVNYHIDEVRFHYPPRSSNYEPTPITAALKDMPFKIAASAGLNGTGRIEGHLIPVVNLDLVAFDKSAKAKILLRADTYTELEVVADGFTHPSNVDHTSARGEAQHTWDHRIHAKGLSTRSSSGFRGCVDVRSGIDLLGGANGNFYGLFEDATLVNIYRKESHVYQNCWPSDVMRLSRGSSLPRKKRSTDLQPFCPKYGPSKVVPVAAQVIKASYDVKKAF